MPWRFSFRALMTSITLLMFAFAAMVSPWPVAANAASLACQFLLCLAVICAFVLPQPSKPFWIGFAVIGIWYWSSLSPADIDGNAAPGSVTVWSRQTRILSSGWAINDGSIGIRDQLPTTAVLDWLQANLHTRLARGSAVNAQYANGGYYPGVIDDIDGSLYLIRWTDGSSSPAQWTPPSQISQITGNYNFRLGGHTIICGLFGIIGGVFAMWLASWHRQRDGVNSSAV